MHETVKVYSRYDKRTEAKHRCKAMVQNVREHGLPCHVSFTAGTYVCNCVMYNVLHLCATKYPNIRAGFIHVPFACEQVVGKASTMASMPLETIAKSLEYCIEVVVTNKEEVKEAIVRNKAVYFAAIGGAGALLSKCIKKSEVIAYDDLGTESIRKLEVENLPVIVVIDCEGNNLYEIAIKEYCSEDK